MLRKPFKLLNNNLCRKLKLNLSKNHYAELSKEMNGSGPTNMNANSMAYEYPFMYVSDAQLPLLLEFYIKKQKNIEDLHNLLTLKNCEFTTRYFNILLQNTFVKKEPRNIIIAIIDKLLESMEILNVKLDYESIVILLKNGYNTIKVFSLLSNHSLLLPTVEKRVQETDTYRNGEAIILDKQMVELLVMNEFELILPFIKEMNNYELYALLLKNYSKEVSDYVCTELYDEIQGLVDSEMVKLLIKHAINSSNYEFHAKLQEKYGKINSLEPHFKEMKAIT